MAKVMKKKVNIKQSNELTEAAYYLGLQAKRVLWLCLIQTYFSTSEEEDTHFESSFRVTVDDYHKIFGISRLQASKDVKAGVLELSTSSVLFFPKSGEFKGGLVTRPWLTEAGTKDERGSWVIDFNPRLLQYIYGLNDRFTTFSLRDCESLKNPRTIRLYESLCQYKSTGQWFTSHDWLSERFKLPDTQKGKISEMKRSFLDPALKVINTKTPLKVSYSSDVSGKIIFSILMQN